MPISRSWDGGHESRIPAQPVARARSAPRAADASHPWPGVFRCGGDGRRFRSGRARANSLLSDRRYLGFAQRSAERGGRNSRPHVGRAASVLAEAVGDDMGQAVRLHDLQLVRRHDLPGGVPWLPAYSRPCLGGSRPRLLPRGGRHRAGGGTICLAVFLGYRLTHDAASVVLDLVYYLAVGVIAQAAALLASLVAVRRRSIHTRFDIFTYQLVGLIAAVVVFFVWEAADPAGALLVGRKSTEFIPWWGQTLGARPFLLASLAIFAAWTLIGCYRLMRLELKMRNGPLVWIAFLMFIGLYVAGFDGWLAERQTTLRWDAIELRLGLALSTYAVLTYLMVLLEPKDRVLYRWLGALLRAGEIRLALWNLQAWMMSYFAASMVAVALLARLVTTGGFGVDASLLVSGMGCLTRDVSIFVLFQTLPGRRRGDFAAVMVLIALYLLMPYILHGMELDAGLAYLYPRATAPLWLGPAVIWAEAIVVAAIAIGRIALSERAEPREAALA